MRRYKNEQNTPYKQTHATHTRNHRNKHNIQDKRMSQSDKIERQFVEATELMAKKKCVDYVGTNPHTKMHGYYNLFSPQRRLLRIHVARALVGILECGPGVMRRHFDALNVDLRLVRRTQG
jgi:hypothetical protein